MDKDKFIYLDNLKNLEIVGINIKENDLEISFNKNKFPMKEIDYCINDFYIENRFFSIQNREYMFNILYTDYDNNSNNNIYLISKESKKYKVKYIMKI